MTALQPSKQKCSGGQVEGEKGCIESTELRDLNLESLEDKKDSSFFSSKLSKDSLEEEKDGKEHAGISEEQK